MNWDLIVIGSGFGGAVMGARMAQKGARVLVLERGRWWDAKGGPGRTAYPRQPGDPWIWNHAHPERENGWIDFRIFPDMGVVQGAAVGGGSQIYANISAEPPEHAFREGWPAEITLAALRPHLDEVARTMNVRPVPAGQWPARTKLMKEAAERSGAGDRFRPLDLAVSFDEGLALPEDGLPDPSASRRFTNAQGVEQGTCVHCGQCDVGCTYDAKNTLDRTYIPLGLAKGMEVRPLHLVTAIAPARNGYTVHFDRLEGGARIPGTETAAKVVVSAGSLGSTELLLRCRDEFGTLKGLSPRLGKGWCSNGDFLTPALYGDRKVHPTHGPTITSAIDFHDGSQGPRFWIQDGGFFNLMGMEAQALASCNYGGRLGQLVGLLRARLAHTDPFAHVMPWFAQGVDVPDGVMRLKKRWYFFGPKDFRLDWNVARSEPVIDAIVAMHEKLTVATGGTALVPPSWSLCKDLVTPHPLGGCGMGTGPQDGVVDHSGQAFGHPGLYVADGSVFPRALGVNPSRTIAALAERTASLMAV